MKACTQCGKCCISYSDGGLSATVDEIEAWEVFNPDIANYVRDGKIWMAPETGMQLKVCPWLRKDVDNNIYSCDIYLDRPEDCKHYPVTIGQMIKDECEMIELQDLTDYKQAQRKLDKLMEDSRPALADNR